MLERRCNLSEVKVQAIADITMRCEVGRCLPSRHSQHWPAAFRACTSWKLLGLIAKSSLPSLALQ